MSRIIRYVDDAPPVTIGDEKRFDPVKEAAAEKRLHAFLPTVAVLTDVTGARLIPILEVDHIERAFISEKERVRREAHQAGHDEGYARGKAEGLQKAEEVLQQLERAINDAVTQREALLEEARHRVLELVVQISRKVTFDAVEVDPETTLGIIEGVIGTLVDRSRLRLKVNPDHLPIIEQNVDRFLKGSATTKEITVEADPRVSYGGCMIETPGGDIDARLESQFEVVSEAILADSQTP